MAAITMDSPKAKKTSFLHLMIPIALVGVLCILLFPLPTALLDVCLALNITLSLVVLFASLYIDRPLDFSSFPAILLITTVFRLSMNVASTRLILLNGDRGMDAAGDVIKAFGEFVVGGNFVIGAVIFLVISIVNLKVITKGSGRIAEVAARFTLDAMPGKQMAIDSDLNTGLINDVEAKRRRKDIAREAEFYGSMDGAAKFVAGDAVAGMFIAGINVVGGLIIGIVMHNMGWMEAAKTYTLLSIGDGLVAQIPSIIISLASGLIVARAGTGEDLGTEVLGQLVSSNKPMAITAIACVGLALLPGLPFLPFMLLGSGAAIMGMMRTKSLKKEKVDKQIQEKTKTEADSKPKSGSTEEVTQLLSLDILELEVGFELVSLVEGGELVERIRSLRRQFATDYGLIIPPIHIRDNVRLKPGEYRFMLRGAVLGQGELRSRHMLAMDPGGAASGISGIPTKEPAFGLDALWIGVSDKERAQLAGYTVVDHSTVVTTHITELVRSNLHELIGRQETQHLLDSIQKQYPKVVEELVPAVLTVGQVQRVLANLLREQISIRDLRTILETLADWAPNMKSPEKLSEMVRKKLSRTLTAKYVTPDNVLPLASISPGLERTLTEALQQTDEGSYLALDPGMAQMFINRLNKIVERFAEMGATPLLLAPASIRPALFHFVEHFVPGMQVLSHQEIAPNTKVQSVGLIALDSK